MSEHETEALLDERISRAIVAAAAREDRCAELLNALMGGGTATVDAVTRQLVIMSGEQLQQMIEASGPFRRDRRSGEKCDLCGSHYTTVYLLADAIWKRICAKPWDGPGTGGTLCPSCADDAATQLGLALFWTATNGEYPVADPMRSS